MQRRSKYLIIINQTGLKYCMNALVEKSESVIEHRKTAIYQSNLNLIISNPPSEPLSVRRHPKKINQISKSKSGNKQHSSNLMQGLITSTIYAPVFTSRRETSVQVKFFGEEVKKNNPVTKSCLLVFCVLCDD